jgi:hypothetical protein
MVKYLIWLECSPNKGTYIGIDKENLDIPCANVRYWPEAALRRSRLELGCLCVDTYVSMLSNLCIFAQISESVYFRILGRDT